MVRRLGIPGYGSRILPWFQSTWAHNTVLVDEKNQARTIENAANLWIEGSELESVQSLTSQAYPGVVHERTVIRAGEFSGAGRIAER